MATLAKIQSIFSTAVFDVERPYPSSIEQVGSKRNTKTRFDIYRNNVFVALIDMIDARFPVVKRLLGDDFFRGTARSYVRAHPPGMHASIEYGATFADFLKTFPPVEDVPYMPDIAALEWACHESRFAKDDPALSIEEAQERLAGASDVAPTLHLHSAARFVSSPYPILEIWETNTRDDQVKPIDLKAGGQDVLVARPQTEALLTQLPEGGIQFILAVQSGLNLEESFARAQKDAPHIDLQAVLICMLQAGAISKISI